MVRGSVSSFVDGSGAATASLGHIIHPVQKVIPNQKVLQSQKNSSRHKAARMGVLLTLAGGMCWGFSGTCAKFLMDNYAVDPIWMVCIRELCASILFLACAAVLPHERIHLVDLVRTCSHDAHGSVMLLLSALSMMGNSICYIFAIQTTNSATATVLQTVGMAFLLIYGCVHAHHAPHGKAFAGVLFALAGTFLVVTGGDPTHLSISGAGFAWGMATALSYALYSAIPASSLARWGSLVVNGVCQLASGLILAAVIHPWEHMPALDGAGLNWLALIIVVGTFLACALYLEGVKKLGALKASMLGTSEPISATLFSVLWLGTTFTPASLIGFALIIAMVYLTV